MTIIGVTGLYLIRYFKTFHKGSLIRNFILCVPISTVIKNKQQGYSAKDTVAHTNENVSFKIQANRHSFHVMLNKLSNIQYN